MAERLTQKQLSQIVAEVARLERQRQDELEPEQVREILRELSLPPELLEEALAKVQQEQLTTQQRSSRGQKIAIATGLGLTIATALLFFFAIPKPVTPLVASQDRLTLAEDNGGNLTTIDRQSNPEVVYRVRLSNAPVGERLALSCNWIAPGGEVMHQNRYQTETVTTPVWNTVCRYSINSADPPGQWQVQMEQNGRVVEQAELDVK
jgi:hypothetical protein